MTLCNAARTQPHGRNPEGLEPRTRELAAVLAVLLALVAAACDMSSSPPPTTCTQIGAQCQMPDGPLGVCQETRCEAGATPPCFACTPQH